MHGCISPPTMPAACHAGCKFRLWWRWGREGAGETDVCTTVNNVSRWEPGTRHVHFISIHNSLADVGLYRFPGICKKSAEIVTSLWSSIPPPTHTHYIYIYLFILLCCLSVATCYPLAVLTYVSCLGSRWEWRSSWWVSLVLFPLHLFVWAAHNKYLLFTDLRKERWESVKEEEGELLEAELHPYLRRRTRKEMPFL